MDLFYLNPSNIKERNVPDPNISYLILKRFGQLFFCLNFETFFKSQYTHEKVLYDCLNIHH